LSTVNALLLYQWNHRGRWKARNWNSWSCWVSS